MHSVFRGLADSVCFLPEFLAGQLFVIVCPIFPARDEVAVITSVTSRMSKLIELEEVIY